MAGIEKIGPSVAELQRFIRNQQKVEFVLNNGSEIVGCIRWFDDQAFSVVQEGKEPLTILRSAVLCYRMYGDSSEPLSSANLAGQTDQNSDNKE